MTLNRIKQKLTTFDMYVSADLHLGDTLSEKSFSCSEYKNKFRYIGVHLIRLGKNKSDK